MPFYLRTGKRLQDKLSEIVITFDDVPHSIFDAASRQLPARNKLTIALQPKDSITLTILAKNPGETMRLKPVDLSLDLAESFKTRQLDAYERLLTDIIKGNLTLFMRSDELDAAWRWIDPIREGWQRLRRGAAPVHGGELGARRGKFADHARRLHLERRSVILQRFDTARTAAEALAGQVVAALRLGHVPARQRQPGCARRAHAGAAVPCYCGMRSWTGGGSQSR